MNGLFATDTAFLCIVTRFGTYLAVNSYLLLGIKTEILGEERKQ